MSELPAYDYFLEQGRVQGAREVLLICGRERFGEPDKCVHDAVRSITNFEELQQLIADLFVVSTWHEFLTRLASPGPGG